MTADIMALADQAICRQPRDLPGLRWALFAAWDLVRIGLLRVDGAPGGFGSLGAGERLPQTVDRLGETARPARRAAWSRPAGRQEGALRFATGPEPPAAGRSIPAGSLPNPWSSRPAARRPVPSGPAIGGQQRRGPVPGSCRCKPRHSAIPPMPSRMTTRSRRRVQSAASRYARCRRSLHPEM